METGTELLFYVYVKYDLNKLNINLVQSDFLFFVGHHKPERLGKANFCLLF